MQPHIENFLEWAIYASRWIIAPAYLGVSLIMFRISEH
jgi:uncharacterized membrane protein YqhA